MASPVKTDPPQDRMSRQIEQRLHAPQLPRWVPWALLVVAVGLVALLHYVVGWGWALSVVASWAIYIIALGVVSRTLENRRKSVDRIATVFVTTAFALALIPLGTL